MIRSVNSLKLFKNLYKTKFLIPKINPSFVRNATVDKSPGQIDQENWSEIYRLPLIRIASAFNKLKIYQTMLTVTGTPGFFALEQAGHLDPNYGLAFASLGITGIITLTICSFPIQKVIGFIYMNDKNDKVKLGYVDFWGRRKDQVLDIEDILTPWEIPERRINIYQPVTSREDESKSFKLIHRFGVIRDPERYTRVFGDSNV